MKRCADFDHLLVLPHLQVQNANAVSSPLTHGFPSMTAFLGAMWALQRHCNAAGLEGLRFVAVGVVCHQHQEQVTDSGFVGSFCLTRNPVDRHGKTAAIVEEGRIHLDLSLLLAVQCQRWAGDPTTRDAEVSRIGELVASMRLAGGSVLPHPRAHLPRYQPYAIALTGTDEDRQAQFDRAKLRLLPGFTLVSRDDLLQQRLTELQAEDPAITTLDAWLSLARFNWRHVAPTESDADLPQAGKKPKSTWQHDRAGGGWIVPIPIGYGALGELLGAGSVANSRDTSTPFRFVESLYSIGQWLSPHRLQAPVQLLWHADTSAEDGHYRCRNDYTQAPLHTVQDAYDFD